MEDDGARLIPFKVYDRTYYIPLQQIQNFPLQDALVNKLVEKHMDSTIPVKLSACGEILIELPFTQKELDELELNNTSEQSCTRHNFEKIVRIYANPKITLFEILDLEHLIQTIRLTNEIKEVLPEQEDILTKSHSYNFLRKSTYDHFLQELDYYGLSSLFESKLGQEGIDSKEIITTFKKNLEPYFPRKRYDGCGGLHYNESSDQVNVLFHRILALGGMFSGSFLLDATMREDWGENKPSDLDIYVNEAMLEGMMTKIHINYHRHEVFNQRLKAAEVKLVNHHKANGRTADELFATSPIKPSDFIDLMKSFERQHQDQLQENVAEKVAKYLDAAEVSIAGTTKSNDEAYTYTNNISYVIKLGFEGGLKMDIIVLGCTIPYQLREDFDFDFCKIYSDGYVVHALKWDAIIKKRSIDRSYRRQNRSYASRIDRIEKYLRRGFVVNPLDTQEYEQRAEISPEETVVLPVIN